MFQGEITNDIEGYINDILFQGKNGEPLELKSKISSFVLQPNNSSLTNLTPVVFVNGLPAVDKQNENSFYQQIAGGKTGLVKYYKKIISRKEKNILFGL